MRAGKGCCASHMLHKQIILCKKSFFPKGQQKHFSFNLCVGLIHIMTFCPCPHIHHPLLRMCVFTPIFVYQGVSGLFYMLSKKKHGLFLYPCLPVTLFIYCRPTCVEVYDHQAKFSSRDVVSFPLTYSSIHLHEALDVLLFLAGFPSRKSIKYIMQFIL